MSAERFAQKEVRLRYLLEKPAWGPVVGEQRARPEAD